MPRKILLRTLFLFAPLLALTLVAGTLLYRSQLETLHGKVQSESLFHVKASAEVLGDKLEEITRDLEYLAAIKPLSEAIEAGTPEKISALEEAFSSFSQHSGLYDQIRWIDETGMERVRVDFKEGQARVIAKDKLQNKGKRYFFTDAFKLQPGEFFVSPLDLNVEQGKVEEPFKPMLRIATPVIDKAGVKRGIVILNYFGKLMLDEFAKVSGNLPQGAMLLNRDGYWLQGGNPGDEWGFMFKRKETFATRHPEVWARIFAETQGQFLTGEGLWTFETVYPLLARHTSSTGAAEAYKASEKRLEAREYFWKAVALDPTFHAAAADLRRALVLQLSGLLLLLFLGCLLVALYKTKMEQAREEGVALLRASETHLRELNGRLSVALDSWELGMWDWDIATDTVAGDERCFRMFGLNAAEISDGLLRKEAVVAHPDDHASLRAAIAAALRGQKDYSAEFRAITPDGETKVIQSAGHVLRDDEGRPLRVVGLNRDVTRQRAAEARARQAEASYRDLFEHMLTGFALHEILTDGKGKPCDYRFLAVNPAFETLTGLKAQDLIGKRVLEALPQTEPYWIESYGKVALEGGSLHFEQYSVELGKYFEVTAYRPAPGQFACLISDVTERTRAQQEQARLTEQLVQAQKMETIGRLAGGVAHDFNNMLGVIIGHAEMVLEEIDPANPMREDVDEILKAARRSADVTRQLLAFARKQAISPKVQDLNEVIEPMLKMLRRLIGEDILLVWRPGADLWRVKVDAAQLDQLLMNLATNARDAIAGAGHLTVETGNAVLDDRYCDQNPGFHPGEYVALRVTDDGCGIPADKLSSIFEPFFTTKELSKGTGLGLATVYGIVKQNGGFIKVDSEVGRGTTIRVYFPKVQEEGERREAPTRAAVGGSESLLVVEDELAGLRLAKRYLESLGYSVVAAATPSEALRLAREARIDLLVTDVILPEMDGKQLAAKIGELKGGGLKCLFMSGYTANIIAHKGVIDDGVSFIQKPYSLQDFGAKVREALGA